MPSPIAAIDLITTAMRKKGILAEGETPSSSQANDGLQALNDVLETWSIQSYAVYASLPQTFQLTAGKSLYSVGPGGDWDTDRPTSLGGAYTTVNGYDFPMTEWSYAEYAQQGLKSVGNTIAQRFVFLNAGPLAQVYIYPTPQAAVPITIDSPRLLTQVPNLAYTLNLPPAYARALQYAVAEEIGVEYGSPIDLSAAARSMLALLKRANRQSPIMGLDPALGGGGYSVRGNFFTG
jgi:hypothetical protein